MNIFTKVLQNLIIKNLLGHIPTVLVTAGKRDDKPPCQRLTLRWVRDLASAEKNMQIRTTVESKTCLIHGPGNSSDECKVLGEFGDKYAKGKPKKDYGNRPIPRKKINRQQKITLLLIMWWMKSYLTKHKSKCCKGSTKVLDSVYDENDIYQVEMMSIEETK